MRFLTLAIALVALFSVAYVSFSTPSHAAVFSGESQIASAATTR